MAGTERTALYQEHLALGGKMVDFGGWELPQQYGSIRDEHVAVRRVAGLFDLSHMGRVDVGGDGAEAELQRLFTNDLARIRPGRAQYTLMCNEEGGILDDLVVYRLGVDDFRIVVNASNRLKDLAWMTAHSDLHFQDRTKELSLLALQGPAAEALLPARRIDLTAVPYFGFAEGEIAGAQVLISRTGYTGEDGFELFVDSDRAPEVWRTVLGSGSAKGVLPCGLGARDACRLEAGLRLYGNDMDEQTNPYQAGLGWTVKLAKGEFIGSAALAQAKARGPDRLITGIRSLDRNIPRHGTPVLTAGRSAGEVTSGTYSFWLNQGIGMASLDPVIAKPGHAIELEVRGRTSPAETIALPIYRGSVRSPAPAKS
ncbi:MAG: glycine cleavage system aminomethyltransferase GcvT [Chloroflexi bacterium]|nr:MAG: glycine cleavage system aminomethyltransferase GcvT [Chloroflexota bacterium]